ncbi:hypothetical protein [Bradyrhizobium cosmicum]|uniref:hypothetical protein n=1 Tax=Bradyrhizobium cosmicum TaxID=1404864 RepID=UPI0028E76274|nr:hypothetical protein [Bradyrhizobium cosmicum]
MPDLADSEIELDGVTMSQPERACDDDCSYRPSAEGKPVIGPSGTVRVMVATKPVDFRKCLRSLRKDMKAYAFSGADYVSRQAKGTL